MANYIDKYIQIPQLTQVQTPVKSAPVSSQNYTEKKSESFGTNILEKFLQNQGLISTAQVNQVNLSQELNLKIMIQK